MSGCSLIPFVVNLQKMYSVLCIFPVCRHFPFVEPGHIFIHFALSSRAARLLELCQIF